MTDLNATEPGIPPLLDPPAPKRRGGLWWKLLLGVFALLVLLVVIVAISFNGIIRRVAITRIEQATGMKTVIDSFRLSFAPPGVRLTGFRLTNPPEFGGGTFLEMPELALSMDREAAREGKLKLHEFRLDLARVNVVVDEHGRSNLDELQKRADLERRRQLAKRGGDTNAPAKTPLAFDSIDRFQLSLGELHMEDRRDPNATRTLRFGWTNEVMTNIVSREDLGGRLLALTVTRGARLDGESDQVTDPISLLSLIGLLLKPGGM